MYDIDKYGYITNGEGTARQAALDLTARGHVILNWTDGDGTLYNIMLSFDPTRVGTLGGMIDGGPGKLWIGVAGHGSTAFGVGHTNPLHCTYVGEKLGIHSQFTATRLADLITEIRDDIRNEIIGDGK